MKIKIRYDLGYWRKENFKFDLFEVPKILKEIDINLFGVICRIDI